MNNLELVVRCACVLCLMAGSDTVVPIRGHKMRETPLEETSGSGSGGGVFVDILSRDCDDEYRQQTDHTMCLQDDVRVVMSGVSTRGRRDIVNFHNEVRASVDPPATDLTKLVWDDLLATVAEKWAKQCILDHDKNRDIPSYGLPIGQNVAAGYRSWIDAMGGWSEEVDLFNYGQNTDDYLGPGNWTQVAHYTQMVQNTTMRLGCGYAECRNSKYGRFYVCNYVRGQSSIEFPYTQGSRCSQCPHSCSAGLCDCAGKLCLNEGRLNTSSCSCSCQPLYKGDNCSEEIRRETTTPLPMFVSKFNCTYIGQRPTVDECKSYGDQGMDTEFCESLGGEFTCGDCQRYSNVKTDYCPVMCALCPEIRRETTTPLPMFVSKFNCTYIGQLPTVVVPSRGHKMRETPLEETSGSGSGDGVFVDILSRDCDDEYRQQTDHTMCLQDDVRVVMSGVSTRDRLDIVNFHNEVRASVDPPATDLTKLVWDDLLATVAEKWAKQCILDHDKNRDIPSYGLPIGQNVAAGYRSWTDAMQGWFEEVDLFSYGQNTDDYLGPGSWTQVAHYTQMVQNTTMRLGCGYAECKSSKYGRFYICNYARGQSSIEFPYTQGSRCSQCPQSCSAGLCDCAGKLCLNEGRLNTTSCSCSCRPLNKGDNCSEEIRRETTTPFPMFVSKFNCTYIGQRPTVDECKSYGDHGMDTEFCESLGGEFTCGDCQRYSNVKTDYCPVMCALCPEVCGGKQCVNGGRLDTDTCLCRCNPPFLGDTCDILLCPEKDKWYCTMLNPDYCNFVNFLSDCPYLCGMCD